MPYYIVLKTTYQDFYIIFIAVVLFTSSLLCVTIFKAVKLYSIKVMENLLFEGDRFMNKKIKTEAVDHLIDALLCLETKEESYNFLEDLCTVNELLSLSQRFEVATMLREHKTYMEIAEKTGASTATISRVNRSLNYGSDGYELIFERLGKTP